MWWPIPWVEKQVLLLEKENCQYYFLWGPCIKVECFNVVDLSFYKKVLSNKAIVFLVSNLFNSHTKTDLTLQM